MAAMGSHLGFSKFLFVITHLGTWVYLPWKFHGLPMSGSQVIEVTILLQKRIIIPRGNWIFLRAKMKSYNATWMVDIISIVQIITGRWLCNVIMSILAACAILLSRSCQGQYVTSMWPWDQSDWFYRDRNIRKPHCSIWYGFIVNCTRIVTERSNSDLRVTLTQKLTLPLWPPSQQTPICQDILLYNE